MHYYRGYTGTVKTIQTTNDKSITAEHRYFSGQSGLIVVLEHANRKEYELFFVSKNPNNRYIFPDTGELMEADGLLTFKTREKTYVFQTDPLEKPCIPEYEFLFLIDETLSIIEDHYHDAKSGTFKLKPLPKGFNLNSFHARFCRETSTRMLEKRYPTTIE